MNKFWQYLLLFVGCVLAQVFIFDNIQLWGFIVPYVYLLYILVLPNNISRPFLYVLGFLLGLSVDLFSSTLCLHAAATTFMASCPTYCVHYYAAATFEKPVPDSSCYGLCLDGALHIASRICTSLVPAFSRHCSRICHTWTYYAADYGEHPYYNSCTTTCRILYLSSSREGKELGAPYDCKRVRRTLPDGNPNKPTAAYCIYL